MLHDRINPRGFRRDLSLPYGLSVDHLSAAMKSVLDTIDTINVSFLARGLPRLEEQTRKATFSSLVSDLLAPAICDACSGLAVNTYHNGFPDTVPANTFPNDGVKSTDLGIEIKVSTKGNAVAFDAHKVRPGCYAVFGMKIDDRKDVVALERTPTIFTDVWIARLDESVFRENDRSRGGTNTASPKKDGLVHLRAGHVYRHDGNFEHGQLEIPLDGTQEVAVESL